MKERLTGAEQQPSWLRGLARRIREFRVHEATKRDQALSEMCLTVQPVSTMRVQLDAAMRVLENKDGDPEYQELVERYGLLIDERLKKSDETGRSMGIETPVSCFGTVLTQAQNGLAASQNEFNELMGLPPNNDVAFDAAVAVNAQLVNMFAITNQNG